MKFLWLFSFLYLRLPDTFSLSHKASDCWALSSYHPLYTSCIHRIFQQIILNALKCTMLIRCYQSFLKLLTCHLQCVQTKLVAYLVWLFLCKARIQLVYHHIFGLMLLQNNTKLLKSPFPHSQIALKEALTKLQLHGFRSLQLLQLVYLHRPSVEVLRTLVFIKSQVLILYN